MARLVFLVLVGFLDTSHCLGKKPTPESSEQPAAISEIRTAIQQIEQGLRNLGKPVDREVKQGAKNVNKNLDGALKDLADSLKMLEGKLRSLIERNEPKSEKVKER